MKWRWLLASSAAAVRILVSDELLASTGILAGGDLCGTVIPTVSTCYHRHVHSCYQQHCQTFPARLTHSSSCSSDTFFFLPHRRCRAPRRLSCHQNAIERNLAPERSDWSGDVPNAVVYGLESTTFRHRRRYTCRVWGGHFQSRSSANTKGRRLVQRHLLPAHFKKQKGAVWLWVSCRRHSCVSNTAKPVLPRRVFFLFLRIPVASWWLHDCSPAV